MIDPVAMILVAILVIAGYVAIAQSVCQSAPNRRVVPVLAIVVLFVYLCAVGFVGLLYFYFGYDDTVIFSALCLFALAALVFIVRLCMKNRETMSGMHVALFLAVCALIAYVTIFIRGGTISKAVRMQPFERIASALRTGSFAEMRHDLLNMMMFVPIGALIPLMNRRLFGKVSYSFLFGLIVSTTIETIQFVAHLGECDINDIIANTIGAVLGYLLCAFVLRVRRNWRIF